MKQTNRRWHYPRIPLYREYIGNVSNKLIHTTDQIYIDLINGYLYTFDYKTDVFRKYDIREILKKSN